MLFSGHQTYFRFPTACTSLVNQGKRLHIVRLVIDVTLKIPKPVFWKRKQPKRIWPIHCSMFSQLLKIEYDNYEDVDTDYLRERTETTIKFIQDNMPNHQQPYQLDGTVDQASSTEWHRAKWCRVTASNAKDIIKTKSKQGTIQSIETAFVGQSTGPIWKVYSMAKTMKTKHFSNTVLRFVMQKQ